MKNVPSPTTPSESAIARMDVVLIIRVAPDIYTVHVDGDGAGKGAVKEKGVTIAKGLRIVCHHQGHNSSSRAKMMQIHLLKICTCPLLDTLQA